MNIENTLNNAVKILNKSKIKNSILDSEILLSQAINRDRKYIFLNSKENLKQKYSKNFNNLIARRRKGEPIAYLINKKEFWKQSFYVDQNVLIPRPDTELIIEQVLKLFLKNYRYWNRVRVYSIIFTKRNAELLRNWNRHFKKKYKYKQLQCKNASTYK